MTILDKAIIFATNTHSGAFRKGTKIPYIVHPLETAAIAASMTFDEEVIAAAVLHDVVEDTPTTKEQLEIETTYQLNMNFGISLMSKKNPSTIGIIRV